MSYRTMKWKMPEQVKLLKQLSTMLGRGYPLLEALITLKLYLPHSKQILLAERIEEMKNGGTFHEILVKLAFHRDVLGYLYFAERHGDLSFALKEASQLLETKVSNNSRMMKVLQYPLILIGTTIGLFLLIHLFLLPQFSTVFETMDIENNYLLSIIMTISKWLPRICTFLFVSLLTMGITLYIKIQRVSAIRRVAYLQKIPIYGRFISKFYSQYFAMQLSQLLKGGLSVYEALSVFEGQTYFTFFSEEATQIKKELRSGETLATIIGSRSYFESELAKSIAFGSINGELSRELYHYSKLSAEAVEDDLNRKMAAIQPTIFLFVGVIILVLYVAIMQPVFQMLNEL
ncbi:competence type IV pilus assembly protein ComGB [Bacillus pinisoli]|uniref:competence type IV pilus assembly protein ComGB n=1 Tax=Bacillus pinisoli TaxID=2901866 RepID=UPI001FF3814E|nr:competence type IV pilus assembly protein ComGB [Bacillus pinisoli]